MSTSLNGTAQESRGKELSAPVLSDQLELLAPVDLDVRTFCRRALRNHLKEAAELAFAKSPIEQALMNLCKTLEKRNNRHLEAEWLRAWAKKWPWFREALAHYWAGDCGFVAIPRLDPSREQERIASCEAALEKVTKAVHEVAVEIKTIREQRELRK